MEPRRTHLDIAISVLQGALLLLGVAPVAIAALMIVPVVFWNLTGWAGVALLVALAWVLTAPHTRFLARRRAPLYQHRVPLYRNATLLRK